MVKLKRKVTLRQKVATKPTSLTSGANSKSTSPPPAGGGRGASGHKRALWMGALGLVVVGGGIGYAFWKNANEKEKPVLMIAKVEEVVKNNLDVSRLLADKLSLSPDQQDSILETLNVDSLVEAHVAATVADQGNVSEDQLDAIVKQEIVPAIDKEVLAQANLLLVNEPVDAKQMASIIKSDLDVQHLLSSELALTEQEQVSTLLEQLNLDTIVAGCVEETLKARGGTILRGEFATAMQKTILPTVRSSLLVQAKTLLNQPASSETLIASATPSSQLGQGSDTNALRVSNMPAAKNTEELEISRPTEESATKQSTTQTGKATRSTEQVTSVSQREVTCLFAFDSDVLEVNDLLVSLAKRAKADASHIVVSAYADVTGDTGYNQALSRRRAESIRHFLIERGVSTERIEIRANGETEQFGSKPNNRRADISLQ